MKPRKRRSGWGHVPHAKNNRRKRKRGELFLRKKARRRDRRFGGPELEF